MTVSRFRTLPTAMANNFNLSMGNSPLAGLRERFIISRDTGLALTDNSASLVSAQSGLTSADGGSLITVTSHVQPAAGNHVFIDKTIVFNGNTASLSSTNTGAHLFFFNCAFIILESREASINNFVFGSTDTAAGNAATVDGRSQEENSITGANQRQSINFYGCNIQLLDQTRTGIFMRYQHTDAIWCDFAIGPAFDGIGSVQSGGRVENTGYLHNVNTADNFGRLQLYAKPRSFQGVEIYDLHILNQEQNFGQTLFVEPNFSRSESTGKYAFNGANGGASFSGLSNLFQVVGPFTPRTTDASSVDNFRTSTSNYTSYITRNNNNSTGGVWNYYGWNPGYFLDAANTMGIQGVRVRVGSSINPSTTRTDAQFHNILNPNIAADQTDGTRNVINEYISGTSGRLQTLQFSENGGSTFSDGYFDALQLNTIGNVGQDRLGINRFGQAVPDNIAIALLQDIRSNGSAANTFVRYGATFQARAYAHDINVTETQTGDSIAEDSLISIDRSTAVLPALSGVSVKAQLIGANNLYANSDTNTYFNSGQAVSINDIRNAFRDQWSRYVTDTGPTDRLNITVDAGHGSEFTVSGANITVRGNELNTTAGDLFLRDTALASVNLSGHPVGGLTLGDTNTSWSGFLASATQDCITSGTIVGTANLVSGNTYTFNAAADTTGLVLPDNTGTAITIRGKAQGEFSSVGTGYLFPFDVVVDSSGVSGGLLSVYVGGTRQTSFTGTLSLNSASAVQVVYTAPGRTDYLFSESVGAARTITVVNNANLYPDAAGDTSGILTTAAPTGTGVNASMNITVNTTETSSGTVNDAFQEHIKGTQNYNDLVARAGVANIVTSLGGESSASLNNNHINLVSTSPVSIRFRGSDRHRYVDFYVSC